MKLDDVFGTAGDHQLSTFDWGASAVLLYNTLVPAENAIDVSHTGQMAFDKLRRLPSHTLVAVLQRQVLVEGGSVQFLGTPREQAAGVPPTVPQGQRRMSPIAIMLMVIMSVIALGLTFSMNNGKQVDPEAFKSVITAMVDILKEENKKDAPASPAEQQQLVVP